MRTAFPDGQWHVRLDGASGHPGTPEDLLAELLATAGQPANELPTSVSGRSATLRALLADRRVLILLDDAASAEQVRPLLLPGTAGNAVIVTSRRRLTGLEGAQDCAVPPLTTVESNELLSCWVDAGRLAADLDASQALISACGGLPLALRIVGGRLAARSEGNLARSGR
ncbi:NB-ARC domain-containing protein [Fodinicola feengrottensis]|uniref:NB-ARC domain-containing protein n=1 Tax=Fodinicola feengrottensis TaxID=435914 RepID=UPI0013D73F2C|nr:NB-ARC domain-containing protein [Fodinicola feengrottensis]